MNSLWPSRPAPDAAPEPPRPNEDVADTGVADIGPTSAARPPQPGAPTRPPLQRQPAPPAPAQSMTVQQATDSLSLMQLRRIVADFKTADPVAYDFVYTDTAPQGEEID